ncbi:hypothetical protein GCWU000324_00924 [Kingella oralis ATCC 51147]|jgi:hypothetical protein|uniref:Uncharacterized protein n=1 Tax=Kingella oralis ATCC 51147 TaxID=629741 RepID=C4GFK8_9NEIS|nr:hypothetical protein GCWU000324_00924 [Kingella oralis ATCC 51147]
MRQPENPRCAKTGAILKKQNRLVACQTVSCRMIEFSGCLPPHRQPENKKRQLKKSCHKYLNQRFYASQTMQALACPCHAARKERKSSTAKRFSTQFRLHETPHRIG